MTPLPTPSLPDRLRAPRRKEEPMSEPDEAAVRCPCPNDTDGDGDCALCARDPEAHRPRSTADEAAVESVAQAINGADNEWADAPRTMPHEVWPVHVARAVLATPVVADAFRDAERLRNLAARFEGHLNREQTYTGAEIAAMLRGDGA